MTDQPARAAPLRARSLLPAVAIAVFTVTIAFFAVGLTKDSRKLPSALIDQPAPGFDLPPLTAAMPGFKTDDLKGRVSLVNVWASWCGPCRVEHPLLMRLAREGKAEVVGINWKDRKDDAENFLKELGNPYGRVGYDGSGRAGIDWGVYGVPETYVVDRAGRIRYKVVGPIMPDELKDRLQPLIESLRK